MSTRRKARDWQGSFKGAFLKGQRAKRMGKSRNSNPYKLNMYDCVTGCVTWGVGFWRAWNDGFDSVIMFKEE